MAERRFIVPSGAPRERLDIFLSARAPDLSRSRVAALIREGAATVAGEVETRAARSPAPGAEVRLRVPPPADPAPRPQPAPLCVVYEDDALIVIDKPAGMVVHPAPGHPDRTLVNALLAHCGDSLSGVGGVRRPGIVHRLDKDTSGLLVAAKTDAAHGELARRFAAHDIERAYLAAVRGVPAPAIGVIDAPIGRHPRHRRKMAVAAPGRGRPARTRYAVVAARGGCALVRCVLETGRTHQIRVHLAHRGWPVIGDPLYGGASRSARAGRQALHACVLGFAHPLTGAPLRFESALPPDIRNAVERLGLSPPPPCSDSRFGLE